MRIAFIGQKGIPAQLEGVEKYVEELATRMAKQGHEVFVYARRKNNKKVSQRKRKFKGVNILQTWNIGVKNLRTISYAFGATLHAAFQEYDVVNYQTSGAAFFCFLLKLINPKAKVVSTLHTQEYLYRRINFLAKWYLKLGERMACQKSDLVIAVSKNLAENLKEKYGTTCVVITNGANVSASKQGEALSKWNLKDRKYILFVGELNKQGGVHYLVEAFKKLEDTSKLPNNFKLVLVGENSESKDYSEYLKMICKGRENIVFINAQTTEELKQIFSHAYIFVQPSEGAGMPFVLLEAMGYGLPVLASDIRENREPLNGAGIYFKSREVLDLRDKLAYFCSRPEDVATYGKLAQEMVQKYYSWDGAARATLESYAQLK